MASEIPISDPILPSRVSDLSICGIVFVFSTLVGVSFLQGNDQILILPTSAFASAQLWCYLRQRSNRRLRSFSRIVLCGCICMSAVVFAALSGPSNHHSRDSKGEVFKALDTAERIYLRGEAEKALAMLQQIDIPARFPVALARKHHNTGLILKRLGRHDEAYLELEKSVATGYGTMEARETIARRRVD